MKCDQNHFKSKEGYDAQIKVMRDIVALTRIPELFSWMNLLCHFKMQIKSWHHHLFFAPLLLSQIQKPSLTSKCFLRQRQVSLVLCFRSTQMDPDYLMSHISLSLFHYFLLRYTDILFFLKATDQGVLHPLSNTLARELFYHSYSLE